MINTPKNPKSLKKRIGLRVPRWATQNDKVVKGIVEFLREEQIDWLIDADIDTENELPPNTIDASWNGDGLIVFRCSSQEADVWKEKGISVINISSETDIEGIPNVIPDNYQMGAIAAEYLVDLGFRKFAYVGENNRKYSLSRQNGFQDNLLKHGYSCEVIDLPISDMLQSEKWSILHDSLNKHLKGLTPPIGVLAKDDIVAMNILRSTRALGIKVPDELALVGINDSSPYCHLASPKLTSVKHPGELIGYQAASLLNQMMQTGDKPENVILKSSGIAERESTNTIAVKDKMIAKAVHIIKTKASRGSLTVSSICDELGVSATKFRLRFIEAVGYTPKELIDKTRHQKVCQFLVETKLSIQDIAYKMHFNSSEDLSRFFTRHEGMPPTKYRESVI